MGNEVKAIMKKEIRKIIYFDKETIMNILQEQNRGSKQVQTEVSTSSQASAEIEAEASVKLNVPVALRISFLFTGRMGAKFLIKRERETTITSTEISEFDRLKPNLIEMQNIQISDIENSSTSFRVAGNYMRFVGGQIDGVDVKEFNAVMNGLEGYDTYKVDDEHYVRFNNTAFVSNYKRIDLLSTQMTVYCIKVGDFKKDTFDFMNQINEMQNMFSNIEQDKTLADVYPPKQRNINPSSVDKSSDDDATKNDVTLFDVVYACVSVKDEKGK